MKRVSLHNPYTPWLVFSTLFLACLAAGAFFGMTQKRDRIPF